MTKHFSQPDSPSITDFGHIFSPRNYRYFLASKYIDLATPKVLDIGGYKSRAACLEPFFDGIEYTSANISGGWYDNEEIDIEYDGQTLPIKENSFDFVVCVDTLEHVVSSERRQVVAEAYRVAKKKAIIVVPIHTPEESCEANYSSLASTLGFAVRPSIVEHLDRGLPPLGELKEYVGSFPHSLHLHTDRKLYWAIQNAMLVNSFAFGDQAVDLNQRIQSVSDRFLIDTEKSQPENEAYRAVIVLDKTRD